MIDYEYKFSVIIPCGNSEKYLESTIESIIHQDIGFKENIQLILVDDGSFNNIHGIWEKYSDMFPNNVIYKYNDNNDTSNTLNEGIQFAKGEYVNFCDSGDTWALDAFRKGYDFFKLNCDSIDIISCRVRMFGMSKGFVHPYDWIYSNDRIVDLEQDFLDVTTEINHCFIRYDATKSKRFNTFLAATNYLTYITEILLEKCKYGILKSAVYNYCQNQIRTSLIFSNRVSGYIDAPTKSYFTLIKLSKLKYGQVKKFVQSIIIDDLSWLFKKGIKEKIPDISELNEYLITLRTVLEHVEDDVIFAQKNLNIAAKIYVFNLKYNRDIIASSTLSEGILYYNGNKIANLNSKMRVRILLMNVCKERLVLEGITDISLFPGAELYYKINHKTNKKIKLIRFPRKDKFCFTGDRILSFHRFEIAIDLETTDNIQIFIKYRNENILLNPLFGEHSRLVKNLKYSYFTSKKHIIMFSKKTFVITKKTLSRHLLLETRFLYGLIKKKQYKVVGTRLLYRIVALFIRKPVWLISDRAANAGDNGEILFMKINDSPVKNDIYPFFAIEKGGSDYEKLKQVGHVIDTGSFYYKLLFLASSKIISSHADHIVTNAFGKNKKYYQDIYSFDFVFLGHGITQGDISGWLNKFNKNIRMFLTSTRHEQKHIMNPNYAYTEKEVVLTGFPRYDQLSKSKTEKKIVIMPTWRSKLAGPVIRGTRKREYNNVFKESSYFKFFESLINDDELIDIMICNGYKGEFVIHPSFLSQRDDFRGNSVISISEKFPNYRDLFNSSALMVTDYSSVQYDFAYLRKPIIYTQFDEKNIEENHMWKKNFDYKNNGFGPVSYELRDTVFEIKKIIESGCKVEKKYLDRMNRFFEFNDNNNSERVLREIMKVDE